MRPKAVVQYRKLSELKELPGNPRYKAAIVVELSDAEKAIVAKLNGA